MPKTDHGRHNKQHTSPQSNGKDKGRFVTDEEREEIIEDVRQFKKRHEKAFRILSEER